MRGLSVSRVSLCWHVGLRVLRADGDHSRKRPLQRRGVVRDTWSAAPASAAIPFHVSRGAPAGRRHGSDPSATSTRVIIADQPRDPI
uniref:Uncharacterized protein n=1 Tax=Ralstonia solanacearum TaxID=305 RepID=A0A0S4TSD5_RALSL|nr:protein of unknown function [Ralstonia solanacearum]